MKRVEYIQNELNECDDECASNASSYTSSYASSTSFICCCCEEEWSNEMRRILGKGNEEICTMCIDIYKTIAGLRNRII